MSVALRPEWFMCSVLLSSAVSSASRPEEETSGEVRDGGSDRSAADLHRLVSSALHVARQVRSRSCEPPAGRLSDHHTGRLPGEHIWTDDNSGHEV